MDENIEQKLALGPMSGIRTRTEPATTAASANDVGPLLCATRMRLGKDLQDVARLLHIRYNYLVAIEDGRFEDLPGHAYAIGFVRAYAEHLGLDGAEIVRRFKDENSGVRRKPSFNYPVPAPASGMPSGVLLVIAVVMGMLVYGAWYSFAGADRRAADLIQEIPDRLAVLLDRSPEAETPTDLTRADESVVASTAEDDGDTDIAGDAAPETVVAADQQTPVVAPAPAVPEQETAAPTPSATIAEIAPPTPAPTPPVVVAASTPSPETAPSAAPLAATSAAPERSTPSTTPPAATTPSQPPPVVETPKPTPVAPPQQTAQTPAVTTPDPAPKPAPAAEPQVASLPPSTQSRPTPPAAAAPAPTPAVQAPKPAAAKSSGDVIELRATSDAWIQVRAGDQLLLTRLLRKGEIYRVPDRTGLTLMTGNAGGLEVMVNGAMMPPLGSEGTVARGVPLEASRLKTTANAAPPSTPDEPDTN